MSEKELTDFEIQIGAYSERLQKKCREGLIDKEQHRKYQSQLDLWFLVLDQRWDSAGNR